MNESNRLMIAFGASFTAGALGAISNPALAQTCACAPSTITRTIAGTAFQYLGSASAGYMASLSTDSAYGFNNSTAPTVYLDVKGAQTGTITSRVCRSPYGGGALVCSGDTTFNVSPNQWYDQPVSVTGVYGATNSIWDYYTMNVSSSGALGELRGIGILASSW